MADYTDDLGSEHCDDSENTPAEDSLETQANASNEPLADAGKKLQIQRLLSEQTERTRRYLEAIADFPDMDDLTKDFARTTAAIIDYWQYIADGENPTSHLIDLGVGVKVNLLMVLAILPERYQNGILIKDESRSANGSALSWLHEDTMNLIIELSCERDPVRFFGQGLTSMVSEEIDNSWNEWYGKSYLEFQMDEMANDQLTEAEMNLYRYPDYTESIMVLFNPTGNHWTLVEIDFEADCFTYTLYNSLSDGEQDAVWNACLQQLPLLEQLICRASDFDQPESRKFILGTSAQQDNIHDCGPITVYNAISLLRDRYPEKYLDTETFRCCCLDRILSSLRRYAKPNPAYWELDVARRPTNSDSAYWMSCVN